MKTFIKFGCFLILLFFVAPFVFMFIRVAINGTGSGSSSAADNPGKAIFDDLNRSITSYKDNNALGNTEQAIAMANGFSLFLKEVREDAFTKGKEGGISLSDGHFITYCYNDDKSLMFFCHVPELRRFNKDAKTSLTQIAWAIAQKTAKENQLEQKQLVVGLRGVALYYEFWFGNTTGAPTNKLSHSDGKNAVYKLLTPPKPKKAPTDVNSEQPTKEHDESTSKDTSEQNPDANATEKSQPASDNQNEVPAQEKPELDNTQPATEESKVEATDAIPTAATPDEGSK